MIMLILCYFNYDDYITIGEIISTCIITGNFLSVEIKKRVKNRKNTLYFLLIEKSVGFLAILKIKKFELVRIIPV